jgi:hypothetical protein
MDEFSSGTADRGSSVRIPRPVERKGYGFLEDRRPSANCDPYQVEELFKCREDCPNLKVQCAFSGNEENVCVQVARLLLKNTVLAQ